MDEEQIQAIAEGLVLSGALDRAEEEQTAHLASDPEWSTPKHLHVKTLLLAFVHGVVSADPWHRGYKLPPDFEGVVNWIAHNLQRLFGDEEVPCISPLQAEAHFREWAFQHPAFVQWNETDKLVGVSHRYSPTPDERDFIDLDAVLRNASCFLRNEIRRDETFERDFNARWEAEHGSPPDWSNAA